MSKHTKDRERDYVNVLIVVTRKECWAACDGTLYLTTDNDKYYVSCPPVRTDVGVDIRGQQHSCQYFTTRIPLGSGYNHSTDDDDDDGLCVVSQYVNELVHHHATNVLFSTRLVVWRCFDELPSDGRLMVDRLSLSNDVFSIHTIQIFTLGIVRRIVEVACVGFLLCGCENDRLDFGLQVLC